MRISDWSSDVCSSDLIESQKEHLRKAWRHDDHYYQDKYGRRFKWLIAGLKLIALKIDSFAWGHGERLWKAPIALTIVLSIMSLFLAVRSEEHTSELQSLMRISYAVFCLKKKKTYNRMTNGPKT